MLMSIAGKLWRTMPRQMRTFVTRAVQSKFTVSAAGVVLNEKGEVLLLDHVLRPRSGWGLPGGFVDVGEQPEAALRRELKEETGLDLKNVRLVRCRTLRRHMEIIFIADGVGEPAVGSFEIKSLAWFAIDDVPPEMSIDLQFIIQSAIELDETKSDRR